MKKVITFTVISALLLASCKKDHTNYPDTPQITYFGINPKHVDFTKKNNLVIIKLDFKSADQNIANNNNEVDSTIFLRDSRDTTGLDYTYAYPMPYIPANVRSKQGVQAGITIRLSNAYFAPKDSLHLALGKDTMFWSIYIKDNDGHVSNVVKTDTIYIKYF